MKFKKLSLDESLFEDEFDAKIDWVPAEDIFGEGTDNTIPLVTDYDDEFVDPEGMPSGIEDHIDAPVGPAEGSDTGVADILISSINDEWETIKKYNSLVATLRAEAASNPNYNAFVKVIEEINNEENKHVGQLQELLKQISPNAESIKEGEAEGKAQLQFANGRLQVQSWGDSNNTTTPTNDIPDICVIDDVDDDM